MEPTRPNIIFIVNHDSGNRLSCFGGPVETPNLDALAARGVAFTNNFAAAPQCSPSRGSILTGKMPHVNGLMGLTNEGWDLPETNDTIPKLLKKEGYSTHLVCMQHVHRDAWTIGYDSITPRRDALQLFDGRIAQKRMHEFFNKVDRNEVKQPFHVDLGIFETHRPFLTGRRKRTPLDEVSLPEYLVDSTGTRKDVSKFDGMLRELDMRVGNILEDLKSRSFAGNTLFIFTTDHGWPFPRAKCTLYDPGVRTSLIMHWPGKIEGGTRHDQLVSNVDLLPTIMEIVKGEVPEALKGGIQGRSFKPLLFGEQYIPRDYVFFELTHHDSGYNPIRGIRTAKWKYIRNFNKLKNALFEIPNDIYNSPSGKAYRDANPGYYSERVEEELYDLEADPWEFNNLAGKPTHSTIKEELSEKLMTFLEKTNDPILKGEVIPPRNKGPLIM
ncbi:MAG: sulfatase [Candidatus Hodarchaeota archaeon]